MSRFLCQTRAFGKLDCFDPCAGVVYMEPAAPILSWFARFIIWLCRYCFVVTHRTIRCHQMYDLILECTTTFNDSLQPGASQWIYIYFNGAQVLESLVADLARIVVLSPMHVIIMLFWCSHELVWYSLINLTRVACSHCCVEQEWKITSTANGCLDF